MKKLLKTCLIFCLNTLLFCSSITLQGQNSYCEPEQAEFELLGEDPTLCEKLDRYNCQVNISNTNSVALGVPGYANQVICISGQFTINSDFGFGGCTIKMAPGSQIVVEAGFRLRVILSKLFACEKMWKGIEVKEKAKIYFFKNHIEDAQYAIRLLRPESVQILHNNFNRNYIGLEFVQSGVVPSVPFTVRGNLFQCSSSQNAPYSGQTPNPETRSFCGIRAQYHPALTIEGYYDGISSSYIKNIFNQLKNGIVSLGSNIKIRNSSFNYMINEGVHHGFFQTGIGISGLYYSRIDHAGLGMNDLANPSFNFCQWAGIYTNASLLSTTTSLHNNIGLRGVFCSNQYLFGASISYHRFVTSTPITSNYILLEKGAIPSIINNNNIESSGDTNPFTKIWVSNLPDYSSMVKIENNSMVLSAGVGIGIISNLGNSFIIQSNIIKDDSSAFAGIQSFLNMGNDYTIKSNTCSGFHQGIFSEKSNNTLFCDNILTDNNADMLIWGPHPGSSVSQNKFYGNSNYGLHLTGSPMLGDQIHKGNIWDGLFGTAALYNAPPLINDSQFFVNSSTPSGSCYDPLHFPNSGGMASVSPSFGWFQPLSFGECQACLPITLPRNVSETWAEAIAFDGGRETYGYAPGAAWDAEYYLYKLILDYPEIYLEAHYDNALNRISTESQIPEWHEINALFKSAADGPAGFTESHLEYEAAISDLLQQIAEGENEYYESGNLPVSWGDLGLNLEYYLELSKMLQESYTFWKEEQIELIEARVQTLAPETPMDVAMYEYVQLKLLLLQDPDILPEILDAIITLSEKCYDHHGSAPSMALSLLPPCIQTELIGADHPCGDEGRPELYTEKSLSFNEAQIQIMPNPAGQYIDIVGPYPINIEGMEIYIFNPLGQMVHQRKLTIDGRIPISHLPSGWYIAKFLHPQKMDFKSVKFHKL